MSNNTHSTILGLAKQAQDSSKPVEARRTALKHIAALRGEPIAPVDTVTEDEVSAVVSGMVYWPVAIKPLSLRDSLETVRQGRAAGPVEKRRR